LKKLASYLVTVIAGWKITLLERKFEKKLIENASEVNALRVKWVIFIQIISGIFSGQK
jgi:hypothetical protein